jgi:glycosyltransferase involved in cell wall biosynthesis
VSVVVPTKDAAAVIGPCLSSLQAQTWPDVEVIVVDNHSVDATAAIARDACDVLLVKGPERCAQRNAGAAASTGPIVVFIDADMTLDPEVLAQVAKAFEDPEVGQVVLTELACAEGFFGRARELEKQLYVGDARTEAARAFRKVLFEEVGGFDEDRNAFEDWELADRVGALGHRTARTTAVTWHHEGKVSLRAQYTKKRYYGMQSRSYLAAGTARRPLSRTSLLRRPGLLARHPLRASGLVVLKAVEATGIVVGTRRSRHRQP